ncbi:hypothetical protein MC378_14840 [Polaribacter sp. MSW13]|uniref:Lipoprotein n=1 Tax=Polaribacter marinus TaxID=2916838 RepID=A0A9X1VPM5_9FLAO|nr:hypothetical protein [Polaribacter marinus]MCI2230454.1 hypothetical protein [Polaribacter marinus]
MKKLNLLIILFITISCKENINKNKKTPENNCKSEKIESVFLKQYLIKTDSCNTFKEFPKVEYFFKEKILMTGFSERNYKQGKWSFFDKKGIEKTSGIFENSQPKGIWNFKDLKTINWKLFDDKDEKYIISAPSDWFYFGVENAESYGVLDKYSKDGNDYNLKLVITSYKLDELDENVNELYNRTLKEFKNNFTEIKSKKVDISEFNEVYEIQSVELNNGKRYLNTELIYSFKDRFYLISISIDEKANYEYSIIKEIMETSFKVYTN